MTSKKPFQRRITSILRGREAGRMRPSLRLLRSAAVLIAAMLVGVISSAAAQAAPGDLDPTFSGDGKQTTDFGFGLSSAAAVVRQPDGKIVAVGTDRAHDFDFALARYNPDGSLDPSFSGDGKQTTSFGGDSGGLDFANGVALQSDGKIVVVGSTNCCASGDDFALARYNPDGSLDPSFSGDGKQTTSFGPGRDGANGVALQSDGKIVVVGSSGGGGASDFALARYNPDGSLDPSFSGDGKQRTNFVGDQDRAAGVALQSDGKIVAVGRAAGGKLQSYDFALARYNPDGSLDPSFSGNGKQRTNFEKRGRFGSTSEDMATGVAIQGDGRIVVVGASEGVRPLGFALARYKPDGSLDPSFSGNGKQRTRVGGATGVALQGDGKIIVVGSEDLVSGGDDPIGFTVVRYKPNGSLDPSFSGDGKQTTFGVGSAATGVALQGNGKVAAVGETGGGFAVVRYKPDGSLDKSFSGDGKQRTDFGGGDDAASGVALQSDGKIVAVGRTRGGGFALARYNANGSLDPSFSGDGRQATDFGGPNGDGATGVAIQGDGKIVAVGRAGGIPTDFALARYNPDGSLDKSFSGDGKQRTHFGGGEDGATGVALQGNKIVAVGFAQGTGGAIDFALARYNANGSLDPSFSGDGKQTTRMGGAAEVGGAMGVAIQGNGKIVAVGRAGGFPSDFALARYNANGSLDATFSGDGIQTTDFGSDDAASGVAIQGDGKIVAVGQGGGGFTLARYNPDGSLDPTFSGDGKETTSVGVGGSRATAVALQGNGKIVAVGFAGGGVDFSDFALVRYNPDGSPDASFSGDGQQTTDFGGSIGDDGATGVALQGDGRIVAVGFGRVSYQAGDFALARYLGG